MNNMRKWLYCEIRLRFIVLGLVLIICGLCVGYWSENFVLRHYDAVRLAIFTNRIGDADRLVVTWYGTLAGGQTPAVSLTYVGGDVRKIIRAVSSSVSARMPDAEIALLYNKRVTFYKGTSALGEAVVEGDLFCLKHRKPPFQDDSGTLDGLVSSRFDKAVQEFWSTNYESTAVPNSGLHWTRR